MSETNKTLDDGVFLLNLVYGKGYRWVPLKEILELTAWQAPKVRRILRSLVSSNLLAQSDDRWRMAFTLMNTVRSAAAVLASEAGQNAEERTAVDALKVHLDRVENAQPNA